MTIKVSVGCSPAFRGNCPIPFKRARDAKAFVSQNHSRRSWHLLPGDLPEVSFSLNQWSMASGSTHVALSMCRCRFTPAGETMSTVPWAPRQNGMNHWHPWSLSMVRFQESKFRPSKTEHCLAGHRGYLIWGRTLTSKLGQSIVFAGYGPQSQTHLPASI